MLSPSVIRHTLERRVPTLAARLSIPPPADREATLRAVSPAYVAAVANGPVSPHGHVHRMHVQGLEWWMPIVRSLEDGPRAEQIEKQRFPFRALSQTRELAVGGIMLDIGANIGRMSIPRVVLGDVVAAYCAEPDPLNYACLVGNILDNGLAGWLMPDQLAIGDRDGTVTLRRGNVSGAHRVVTAAGADPAPQGFIDVPSLTLDTWMTRLKVDPDAVNFVKVDVQGYESRVLQGATALRSRRHVAWQIEVEPDLLTDAGSSLSALCEQMSQSFETFIDLTGDLGGGRDRPVGEIREALGYLGGAVRKTEVLLF